MNEGETYAQFTTTYTYPKVKTTTWALGSGIAGADARGTREDSGVAKHMLRFAATLYAPYSHNCTHTALPTPYRCCRTPRWQYLWANTMAVSYFLTWFRFPFIAASFPASELSHTRLVDVNQPPAANAAVPPLEPDAVVIDLPVNARAARSPATAVLGTRTEWRQKTAMENRVSAPA
eukprot:scaffold152984_cov35-Tisochrysis_lutea.AAC.2